MTKEHALRAYKHYKDLLKNPKYDGMKKVWKDNVQHGIDSILIRHPEFETNSKKKEPEEETKSKKNK